MQRMLGEVTNFYGIDEACSKTTLQRTWHGKYERLRWYWYQKKTKEGKEELKKDKSFKFSEALLD